VWITKNSLIDSIGPQILDLGVKRSWSMNGRLANTGQVKERKFCHQS
jgi:hypothetical protein